MSVNLDNLASGPFLIALLLARCGIMLSLCAKPMRALIQPFTFLHEPADGDQHVARRLTKTMMQRSNY